MRYQTLNILVTLVTFAAMSMATALSLRLCWGRLKGSLGGLPAVARARRLFWLRLAPTVLGLFVAAVAMLAFLRYEPRPTSETPGWIVLIGAGVGACAAIMGLWRVVARSRATSRFLHSVRRTATPVTVPGVSLPTWQLDIPFPLVALAGMWRPHLLIARHVLDHVPGDELRVILNHELAHARRRDNAAQLLLAGLPDILNFVPRGMERAWQEATEDAADELATGTDAQARICLASALIRVAKMAGTHTVPAVPLLAFHSGESVERRVHRLLDGPDGRSDAPSILRAVLPVALLTGVAGWWLGPASVLRRAHHAIEWLVNTF